MAPRANWKGFLRLSLVTCPVALYPATSDSEKISFNQINRKTGHRIKYAKVDADTGEEVPNEDIMKGYKVDTDTYIEVSKDELENIALESPARLTSTSSSRRTASTHAISSGLTT
jgi:DNA end-binding protein Ku